MQRPLPKISIVTPSFNQAEFLEATIQSVLQQNYPNLEYIIIDGGSTDGSVEIIQRYENQLHYWCSEPDAGQYDAINKGFAHTSGDIMAWINSDDLYCPWAFKTVASIMSELPQVQWLSTLTPAFWDWHGFALSFNAWSGYSKEAFLDGYYLPGKQKAIGWIQQESTFWHRSLWELAGSYVATDLKLASDFELWSRFYHHAELYGTASPLGGFRFQANQRSRQIEHYTEEAEMCLQQMRARYPWKPALGRSLIWHLHLDQIPKVRTWTKPLYSYTGRRVVRQNYDSVDGYWQIEQYQFP